ncbi:hypothetical protein [Carboxylicivirga linearis]|uniref:Outer membrane insertion C-signal n=1 Tax=Carboxylicivirga linearis TaxID=1628157 RepID=A0ABS5JYT0_9BACT|nr:hypothetical protein [Carboxylicivirga linearis]MBS2099639.1 hypothetical protein [Carboxylicivirga linearis]
MKKIVILALLVFGAISISNAQEVGIRFGDVTGGNVAIDGVFSLGEFTRVHADVSFGDGLGIDALWDFLYRPLGGEAFNWYVGAGPYTFIGSDFKLGAVGEVGLEYHFNGAPLAIGADWRPYLEIIDNTNFGANSFGLNVRFCF